MRAFSLWLCLAPLTAAAFPPISTNTIIPGPPAAAPQTALTSSWNCDQVVAQGGVNVWTFNPGNGQFHFALRPSHPGTNPNVFPPIPAGHSYNPVGPVAGTAFAQSDCGASTGPLSTKLYGQNWACWPGTVKAGGSNCQTTTPICPIGSNATLVGGNCACLDPAYPIEDAVGRTCRVDPCTLLNCDDGRACTVDSCRADAGCLHSVDDLSTCTCSGAVPPTVSASGGAQVDLSPIACPALGGNLTASLDFAATGTYQAANCTNTCTSQASMEATAELSASLCSKDSLTVTGTGTAGITRAYLPTCNASTCGSDCGSGYCGTVDTAGSIAVRQTRFAGLEFGKSIPGGGKVAFKCGGTLEAGGTLGAASSERQAVGQAPACVGCVNKTMNLTARAAGDLTCALDIGNKLGSAEFGCKDCVAASVTMTGTLGLQSGACGNQNCAGLLSSVEAHGNTPRTKAKFLWWAVETACSASVQGCGEANGCGPCTCGNGSCAELTTSVTCTVCGTNTLLPPCN